MNQTAPVTGSSEQTPREVGLLLAIGIVFLPGIFVWFLVRGGHSTLARVLGFGWFAIVLIFSQVLVTGSHSLADAPQEEQTVVAEQGANDAGGASQETEASVGAQAPKTSQQAIAPPTPPPKAALTEEQRLGMHCLNKWDGSHRKMQDAIKERLRDPDSFKHVETRITPIDKNGNHTIFMTFRARNGFGGLNVQQAIGVVDNEECELQALQM